MLRNIIAILLASIFTLIVVMPTFVIVLDDSVDVSMFYTASEEEKDKTQEKDNEKDFMAFELNSTLHVAGNELNENNLEYYFEVYKKPNIKLAFPPPKPTL